VVEHERRAHVTKDEFHARVPELREQLLEAQFVQKDRGREALLLVIAGPNGSSKAALGHRLCEWLDMRFVETHAFEAPSALECAMPRFWRYWWAMPAKGSTALYYGSWYTDLLREIVEQDPKSGVEEAGLENALRRINALERMLSLEGIRILKVWLATEDDEKAKAKADADPRREPWQDLVSDDARWETIGETIFRITSTGHAPWVIVDGDDARTRDLSVGEMVLEVLGENGAGAVDQPGFASPALDRPQGRIVASASAEPVERLDSDAYSAGLAKQQKRFNKAVESEDFEDRSLLLVFEGVDAAGKGGTIRRVIEPLDPRRFRVRPFSAPNAYEQMYPYLWRFWIQVPHPGQVVIFDRSHYGRVLVERVEGLCSAAEWARAYSEIGEFEQQLIDKGTIIQKFWLQISKAEQLRRFEARRSTPWKRHKITDEDWRNRSRWDDYEKAAAEMIERTHRSDAPWHIIDSEDKRSARVQVLEVINRELRRSLKDGG